MHGPLMAPRAEVYSPPPATRPFRDFESLNIATIEELLIDEALARAGSIEKAVKLLGIGRATLYRRLAKRREHERAR